MRKLIKLLLPAFVLCGAALLTNKAQAQLNMPEREQVQTIVWIVESVTFVTAIAIALVIWKISTRSRKSRDRDRTDSKGD
jgi:heme/copper-type cytochrome/quinol oxidase subunit 2